MDRYALEYNLKLMRSFFHLFLLLASLSAYSQNTSYGLVNIERGGEAHIYNHLNFFELLQNNHQGIIGTERGATNGYISFMSGATYTGGHNRAFVDGYVRSYQNGIFVFPVGDNGEYRPMMIMKSSSQNPTDAAYYSSDPSVAMTSPFVGKFQGVVPSDGPYERSAKSNDLSKISDKEYWDINGNTATKISLSWNTTSSIQTLTNGILYDLTIVGWTGTHWVKIPSAIDVNSFFGKPSDMTSGSITTIIDIIPNTYRVYTLAALVPDEGRVFAENNQINTISQGKSKAYTIPYNSRLNDTNLLISVQHSAAQYGTITNSTMLGYNYTASNSFIAIDTILTIATILNKRTNVTTFDTFINRILVRYYAQDEDHTMTSSSIQLGKIYQKNQAVLITYTCKGKLGTVSQYQSGKFNYSSSQYDKIDTIVHIVTTDYMGLNITKDTSRYIVKLRAKPASISASSKTNYQIQNLITSEPGMNFWKLPSDLVQNHKWIQIKIFNLNGKLIYQGSKDNLEWHPVNEPNGFYSYQILLDDGIEISDKILLAK